MENFSNKNACLTMDEIRQKAPSVFTSEPQEGVSKKYTHIPTSVVVEDLQKLGWNVTKAVEIKARKRQGYQKHMVVFNHHDIVIKGENGDDLYPQVLLTNSHDGKCAFHFRIGLFRLVCSNGLVVSDRDFEHISMRHFGYTFDDLKNNIEKVIKSLPNLVEKINIFRSKELSQEEMEKFAEEAIKIRYENGEVKMDVSSLLEIERTEDGGNDLFSVYNRVQEKVLGGGFRISVNKGKQRKARPIKNFTQDIRLNEKLFELAESFI